MSKAEGASGADIGLVGLAVMGENLILNMESKGFTVACYNRTVVKVDRFLNGRAKGKKIVGCHSPEELVKNLKTPRRIMLMVKAGKPVDAFIDTFLPRFLRALVEHHHFAVRLRVLMGRPRSKLTNFVIDLVPGLSYVTGTPVYDLDISVVEFDNSRTWVASPVFWNYCLRGTSDHGYAMMVAYSGLLPVIWVIGGW